MFAVRVIAKTPPYGGRKQTLRFMHLGPGQSEAREIVITGESRSTVFYSVYLQERVHAERLAAAWKRHGQKPPFAETSEIYEDQYDAVPADFISMQVEIVDTAVDEVSYNGDDPRYAGWYADRANRLVAKLGLNRADGAWSTI